MHRTELLEGGAGYVAWQRLALGGWGVGVGVPAAQTDAADLRALLFAFGVAASCLVLSVGAALLVARRIAGPLGRLAAEGPAALPGPAEIGEIELLRGALQQAEQARAALIANEQAARHAAEAASRAKDELLALLGHELRNPLNAIVTSVEVLRQAEPASALAASARAVLGRQSQELSALVDRLVDAGRLMGDEVTLQPRRLPLAPLVRSVAHTLRPRALERGQTLVAERLAGVWVRGDAQRLEQVLGHLLDNALRFTPEGGRIEVELALRDGLACLAVRDDGPGIEPALLARIFEPFVQGETGLARTGAGLGLGLTLVKRLVALHGGSVQIESGAAGTVVEVRLTALPPPALGALRVAAIDDNPDSLAGLRSMLDLAGHEVVCAEDGRSGLALLLGETPAVAVVDIGLPGIDGYEVARRARAAGFRGRLIALSGYGQGDDTRRSLEAGFDAHLVKPVDPVLLFALLAE